MNKRGDFFKNPYTIVLTILVLFVFLVLITLLIKPPAQEKTITSTEEEDQECKACKDLLQTNVISIQGKIEECQTLKNEDNKKRCKYNIIFNQAYSTNDIELCNQLEDSQNCKDNFLLMKAFEENNKELCSQIQDPTTKQMCST